jgi:hypothetical protein
MSSPLGLHYFLADPLAVQVRSSISENRICDINDGSVKNFGDEGRSSFVQWWRNTC